MRAVDLARAGGLIAALATTALPVHGQVFTSSDKAGVDRALPPAADAMNEWFGLVDQRSFEGAWERTAQVFRKEQDRNTWITTQYRYRDGTSPVSRRQVISSRYTRTLKPFSTIDAVTFQVALYFVNETLGIETIVLVNEDGAWRVASYLFNPGPIVTTPAPLGY